MTAKSTALTIEQQIRQVEHEITRLSPRSAFETAAALQVVELYEELGRLRERQREARD